MGVQTLDHTHIVIVMKTTDLKLGDGRAKRKRWTDYL